MPSRIPIILYLAFCLHSALITLKTLIFRPLQRVDKVEIRLHSSLHLSALACICLHLLALVCTCTIMPWAHAHIWAPALTKMCHGNKIILYRDSDNSVGVTVFSPSLYLFSFRTNNFAAFGKQRRENASKPLVQTSVDSSVDVFWLYLHAKNHDYQSI